MNPRASDPQTRVRVPLPDDDTAPSVARRALRSLLRGWRLPGLVEPVVLAASELVTNAFRHGEPPVQLTVRRTNGRVSVAVGDGSPTLPVRTSAAPEAQNGRGMVIVESVASETGSRRERAGKVVWAGFDIDREDER